MDDMRLQFEIYGAGRGFNMDFIDGNYTNKPTRIAYKIWVKAWETSIEFIVD